MVLHLCNTGLSEGCGNISYATKSTGLVVVFNQYLPDGEVELQSLISLQETAGWLAGSLLQYVASASSSLLSSCNSTSDIAPGGPGSLVHLAVQGYMEET